MLCRRSKGLALHFLLVLFFPPLLKGALTYLTSDYVSCSFFPSRMERTVYNLLGMRDLMIRRCKEFQIPTDWMLDTGILSKVIYCFNSYFHIQKSKLNEELLQIFFYFIDLEHIYIEFHNFRSSFHQVYLHGLSFYMLQDF